MGAAAPTATPLTIVAKKCLLFMMLSFGSVGSTAARWSTGCGAADLTWIECPHNSAVHARVHRTCATRYNVRHWPARDAPPGI